MAAERLAVADLAPRLKVVVQFVSVYGRGRSSCQLRVTCGKLEPASGKCERAWQIPTPQELANDCPVDETYVLIIISLTNWRRTC